MARRLEARRAAATTLVLLAALASRGSADDNWQRQRWDPTTTDPTVVCDSTADGSYKCYTCPRGKYRSQGLRRAECVWCPRGVYGATEGLTDATCTAPCPVGRYNDQLGAKSDDDCRLCPPGKYGKSTGLLTHECSGTCPVGTYSSLAGIDTSSDCVQCPVAYRGWQCTRDSTSTDGFGSFGVGRAHLIPRRDTFLSTDGHINELAHAYVDGAKIPQGRSPITFTDLASPLFNEATGPYDGDD